jgi:transcriptional regulator with XRE-family HTH domain
MGMNRFLSDKEWRTLQQKGIVKHPPRKFKKGQKNKWLLNLLKIIGWSQSQLAESVGVSTFVIANVASGRSPLKQRLAQKIYVATGASAWTYFRGLDQVFDPTGEPYTRATFDYWRKRFSDADEIRLARFYNYASETLHLLLLASAKSIWKNRLAAIEQSFLDWCMDSYKFFRLEGEVSEILKERKSISEMTMSYGNWRSPEMEGQRAFYEFEDDSTKPDEELATFRVETWPGWSPCGNMQRPPDGIKKTVWTGLKQKPADKKTASRQQQSSRT